MRNPSSIMEKDIPRQRYRSTDNMFARVKQFLSPPYFKRSPERRFEQLPTQYSTRLDPPMDYEQLTLFQALRKWRRISWIAMAVAMNILLWGFDSGIVGNLSSMPTFQYALLYHRDQYMLTHRQRGIRRKKSR